MRSEAAETHPSFGAIVMSTYTSSPPQPLFDSSVPHSRFVVLKLHAAQRERRLHTDWIMPTTPIVEVWMSQAQWGQLVSSFGDGGGTPVTIAARDGKYVEQPTFESRLAITANEVAGKTREGIADVEAAIAALRRVVDAGGGKAATKAALRDVEIRLGNLPANMRFAATSLTEHAEDVVSKAKADIEAMVERHAERIGVDPATATAALQLGVGEPDEPEVEIAWGMADSPVEFDEPLDADWEG